MRAYLWGPLASLLLIVSLTTSQAHEQPAIAGVWWCASVCFPRYSHALATITIDGEYAVCENERGDISKGDLLTDRSVRCFGIVGELANDNETIQWSDGNVWRRDHTTKF